MTKDEDLNSDMQDEVSEAPVQNEVAELESKVAELKDLLARSAAEQDNMRKRFDRDSKEYAKYAVNNFVLSVLEVIDNLELALRAAESDKNIHLGISMVYKQIISVLEAKEITQINTNPGDMFDSEKHEIIEEIDSDKEKNTIEQIKFKGYVKNGSVLRHAKVSVSKGQK